MTSEQTVFVIDDEKDLRVVMCAQLQAMGIRCQAFASGEEFLEAYDPAQRGCLVADLRLNGIDGLELQSEVARRGWMLPVIIVSGYVSVPSAVRAMKTGAVNVLKKPYGAAELWDAIQFALQREEQLRLERARREAVLERFSKLTQEERHVLDLIAAGAPNKTVARRLDIALRTVEDRRRRLMRKVGADSFAGLMTAVVELKAIEAEAGQRFAEPLQAAPISSYSG